MRGRTFFLLVQNTVQKEYRNKTLIFLFLFTLFILWMDQTFFDFIKNKLFQGQVFSLFNFKLDLFYYIISSWNFLMGAVLGVSCLRSDVQEGVLEEILSLPLSRINYITSRLVGTWLIVMGYYILSLLLAFLVFGYKGKEGLDFAWPLFSSLIMSSIPILAVITLGALFSLFFSRVWALLITLLFSSFVSFSNEIFAGKYFEGLTQIKSLGQGIYAFLHTFFPHIGTFNTLSKELFGNHELTKNLSLEIMHFGLTFSLLLFILLKRLRNMENYLDEG